MLVKWTATWASILSVLSTWVNTVLMMAFLGVSWGLEFRDKATLMRAGKRASSSVCVVFFGSVVFVLCFHQKILGE